MSVEPTGLKLVSLVLEPRHYCFVGDNESDSKDDTGAINEPELFGYIPPTNSNSKGLTANNSIVIKCFRNPQSLCYMVCLMMQHFVIIPCLHFICY